MTNADNGRSYSAHALVNSGATGNFIDKTFVVDNRINSQKLEKPIPVKNADGSNNRAGPIEAYVDVWLTIQTPDAPMRRSHSKHIRLEITALANDYQVILGLPWLEEHNPSIDWQAASIDFNRCAHPTMIAVTSTLSMTEARLPDPSDSTEEGRTLLTAHERKREEKALVRTAQGSTDSLSSQAGQTQDELLPPCYELQDTDWRHQLHHSLRVARQDHSRSTTVEDDMHKFVPKKYWEYADVFMKTTFDTLPEQSEFDHAINLTDDFKPQPRALYKLSELEQQELDKFLDENLSTGRIVPSKSRQAAPFFFAKKMPEANAPNQNPGLRPIQDYRHLNKYTIVDGYPPPLLDELLNNPKLQTATIFTVIDIRWGFNNIRIKEGDEWKAAFITNRGTFELTVMFFGLCNSPAMFQRMVNTRFRAVLRSGCVHIYIDDVLILGDTPEELEHWTRKTLDIMRKYKLSCKPVKCQFKQSEVKYLGRHLVPGGLRIPPDKAAAILEWPMPVTVKQVESFLGTCNFWRKFIQDYSNIAHPLNALRRKDVVFDWTDKCQQSFDALKHAITTAPILKQPRCDLPFHLQTDTSQFAWGAVLSQEHDGKWHPVCFASHRFTPAQQRYGTPDQELIAIVKLLEEWRHLLEGAKYPFVIRTDNLALKYFMTKRNLTRQQVKYIPFLTSFHFTIEHVPRVHNVADGLSRRPDHTPEDHDPYYEETLLHPRLFINAIVRLHGLDYEEQLRHSKPFPPSIVKRLNERDSWSCDVDGIIRDGERIVVLADVMLREDLIRLVFVTGHTVGDNVSHRTRNL
jgi:hypothetical protein